MLQLRSRFNFLSYLEFSYLKSQFSARPYEKQKFVDLFFLKPDLGKNENLALQRKKERNHLRSSSFSDFRLFLLQLLVLRLFLSDGGSDDVCLVKTCSISHCVHFSLKAGTSPQTLLQSFISSVSVHFQANVSGTAAQRLQPDGQRVVFTVFVL